MIHHHAPQHSRKMVWPAGLTAPCLLSSAFPFIMPWPSSSPHPIPAYCPQTSLVGRDDQYCPRESDQGALGDGARPHVLWLRACSLSLPTIQRGRSRLQKELSTPLPRLKDSGGWHSREQGKHKLICQFHPASQPRNPTPRT